MTMTIIVRRPERTAVLQERNIWTLLDAALKDADIARTETKIIDLLDDAVPTALIEFIGPAAEDFLRRIIGRRTKEWFPAPARSKSVRSALAGSRSGRRSATKEGGL